MPNYFPCLHSFIIKLVKWDINHLFQQDFVSIIRVSVYALIKRRQEGNNKFSIIRFVISGWEERAGQSNKYKKIQYLGPLLCPQGLQEATKSITIDPWCSHKVCLHYAKTE